MAGPNPAGFDPAALRAGLITAMKFGMSTQVVFVVPSGNSASVPADDNEVPFNPTQPAVDTETELTSVPCSYELKASGNGTEEVVQGVSVQVPRLVVTVLQEEYDLVSDAVAVVISGTRYDRVADLPTYNLGTVPIYQMTFQAGDAT